MEARSPERAPKAERAPKVADVWALLRTERRPWLPLDPPETAKLVDYDRQKLGMATTATEAIAALSVNIEEYALPELWNLWARLADDGRVGRGPFSYTLPAAEAWVLADQWLGLSTRGASLFGAALISLHPDRRDQIKACADVGRLCEISQAASKEDAFALLCE